MAVSTQSSTLPAFLDAVKTVLGFSTELNANHIIEFYGQNRPRFEGDQAIVFRVAKWIPEEFSGGGELASITDVILEVMVWTRFSADAAGVDYAWMRNQGRGHWLRQLQILNALQPKDLFDAYDDTTHLPTGNKLTTIPLQQTESDFATKLEQDPSWGVGGFAFRANLVLPLTIVQFAEE